MTHLAPEDLSAFLDGEVADAAARAHVHACPECQHELRVLQQVDALTAQAAQSWEVRPHRRAGVLTAALLLLGGTLMFGGRLADRLPAASESELLAVQEQILDGLELQAGGLSLCLDTVEGDESESLSRLLAQVRADLAELRREHEDLSEKPILRR